LGTTGQIANFEVQHHDGLTLKPLQGFEYTLPTAAAQEAGRHTQQIIGRKACNRTVMQTEDHAANAWGRSFLWGGIALGLFLLAALVTRGCDGSGQRRSGLPPGPQA